MKFPIDFRIIRKNPIIAGKIKLYLVWFDSYGAKSSCIFIKTPDIKMLVDPGAASMQPSYPLPNDEKENLYRKALDTINRFSHRADTVFISHYHYDHHTLPLNSKGIYRRKRLWIKDPNQWINKSQWKRARLFLNQLHESYGAKKRDLIYTHPENHIKFNDPLKALPFAMSKDYGDYKSRKLELLEKGKIWFNKLTDVWKKGPWILDFKQDHFEVKIADGRSFKRGETNVGFTGPMFHGIEYDRVGWVIGLKLEYKGRRLIYSSDLHGPTIEDYAKWIIDEDPDVLILDGPATYLFGYMVNRINLERAIENICDILRNTKKGVIIYDHHLLRDIRYKSRLEKAYLVAKKEKKTLFTAAEWLGYEPLILKTNMV